MVQGLKQAGEDRHEHQLRMGRDGRRKTRELEVKKVKRRIQSLPVWPIVSSIEDRAGDLSAA